MSTAPALIVHPQAQPVQTFSTRELDRSASHSLLWQIAKMAIQLAQYVVFARLVPPAEFGKLALLFPLFAILTALNDGGLSTAAVTGKSYDARLASNLWWTQAALGVAAGILMLSGAPLFGVMFGVSDLFSIGIGLAVALVVESWGLQSRARLRREMRIGRLGFIDACGTTFGIVTACVVSSWLAGVQILVVAHIAGAVARTALAFAFSMPRLYRFSPSAEYASALRTGCNVAVSESLNVLRVHVPMLIIGFFVALHDVGAFGRALQLSNVPLLMLGPAIANFLLPLLARSRESAVEFSRHVRRTQRLFLAAAIPLSVWIAFGPEQLIAVALGPEWAPVVPILQALSPLFLSQIVATIARITLLATEQAHVDRRFSFWNLVLTALAVVAAAPFGIVATALALSVSAVCLRAPLLVSYALRRGTITAADITDGIRILIILACSTTALLWLTRLMQDSVLRDLLTMCIAASVSLCAIIFVARSRADL